MRFVPVCKGLKRSLLILTMIALAVPAVAQGTPIQHIVFIIKENRSFDNIFGLFPGADGASSGLTSLGQLRQLTHAPDVYPRDMCHTWNCNIVAIDHGRVDKWDVTVGDPTFACNLNNDYLCYSQYQQSDVPNYYTYASTFALGDHMYSAIHATSFPNHIYVVAASSNGVIGQAHLPSSGKGEGGCDADPGSVVNSLAPNGDVVQPFPCFDITTLADTVTNAGLSWIYYGPNPTSYNGLEPINHLRNVPSVWNSHNKLDTQFVTDAAAGNLPSVSWLVTTDPQNEHPPNSMCNGENWTVRQLNAVMQGPDWNSTAVIIVWDDSGGLYDHSAPPVLDQFGPGPRVPLLIVSPYVKPGTITHTQYEHSSLLKFAETIFGLPSIAFRDSVANDMTDAFDFNQSPLPPLILNERSCSPASGTELDFNPQLVDTPSPIKTTTITNYGPNDLTINSIVASGDYTQTNNCPAVLPAPSPGIHTCTVNLTFTPKQTGTRTGTLTITDSDPSSPQLVALTGVGTQITLNPSLLSFGLVSIGQNKTSTAILKNASNNSININSIVASGPYTQTNDCGSSLGAGQQCTLTVTFAPSTAGILFGTVTVSDSDGGSPQLLSLTGTGSSVKLSPGSLKFPATTVGTTSTAMAVTMKNQGNGPLNITSIVAQGTLQQDGTDFKVANTTCPATLGAGLSCTINVTFTPTAGGSRLGTLFIFDSEAGTSPQSVALSGSGSANGVPFVADPLVPTAAAPGGASFTLVVNGSGFANGAVVNWNGSSLATTFVNRSKLTATVPAANISQAGTALVTVTNPAPAGGVSNLAEFQIGKPGRPGTLVEVDMPVGSSPTGLVRADLDGDGILDIAVANTVSNTLSIAIGDGTGKFKLKSSPKTGSGPTGITVGDFNRDGKPDLAVTNSGDNTVTVLLGNGDGTFTAAPGAASVTGAGPVAVAAGDYRHTGLLGLLTADATENLGSQLTGNGDGTFDTDSFGINLGKQPSAIVLGDFNGDGFLDATAANTGDNTFSVLPGNGDGTFTWSGDLPTGTMPSSIIAADFNKDGIVDIAVADKSDSTVSVYLGAGNGTFTLKSTPTTGTGPIGLVAGDFDSDGKLDIATANATANSLSILRGNADGTFQAHTDSPTKSTPGGIIAGDFNRDGKLDIAVTSTTVNKLSVFTQP